MKAEFEKGLNPGTKSELFESMHLMKLLLKQFPMSQEHFLLLQQWSHGPQTTERNFM